MTEGTETICVQGARVHNLKNIDVEIPRDSLTVITGLSGSGKSSLAFDTLFVEGQRRYIETFSAYARAQDIHSQKTGLARLIDGSFQNFSLFAKGATALFSDIDARERSDFGCR